MESVVESVVEVGAAESTAEAAAETAAKALAPVRFAVVVVELAWAAGGVGSGGMAVRVVERLGSDATSLRAVASIDVARCDRSVRCSMTDSPRCTIPADHVVVHETRDCETSSSIDIGLASGGKVGTASGGGSPPATLGGSGVKRCGEREGEEVERGVGAMAAEVARAAEGASRTSPSKDSRIAAASDGEDKRADRRAWNKGAATQRRL